MKWIGAAGASATYCIATVSSGVTNLDEMLADEDFTVGIIGQSGFYPATMAVNNALGGHFRFVFGFDGVAELNLAMARGEIDGVCGASYSSIVRRREVVDIVIIAELASERGDQVENAEFLLDRVTDPLTREALNLMFVKDEIYYPLIAHPDTPDEIVEVLRSAYAQLAADQAFLDDAVARLLEPLITDGATVQAIADGIHNAPDEVKQRLRELVTAP